MKTNFYKRLLNGEEATSILIAAAEHAQTNFSSDVAELEGNEVTQFCLMAIKNVRTYGIGCILLTGMQLEMVRQLTLEENGIFANVLEDLGLSKTQAYRGIRVWKYCGQRLANKPELTAMFVPEALKLLCEANVPEEARMEAFALAGNGKQINIRVAKEICAKHCPEAKKEPIAPSKKEKPLAAQPSKTSSARANPAKSSSQGRKSLLAFVGDFARLVVQTKGKTVDVTTTVSYTHLTLPTIYSV